ncbi:MAG: hypothetical protein ACRDTD_30075, partial [Pseudonocardiaceae bacterium]
TNSLVGEMQGVIEHCYKERVAVGGPDVLPIPQHVGISGDRIIRGVEPGAVRDYRGKTPIFYHVESPELGGKEGTFTLKQLRDHAVVTQGANYVFWARVTYLKPPRPTWNNDVLPYLRSASGGGLGTNTGCPENFRGACNRD